MTKERNNSNMPDSETAKYCSLDTELPEDSQEPNRDSAKTTEEKHEQQIEEGRWESEGGPSLPPEQY
jgi:hypothetical protein